MSLPSDPVADATRTPFATRRTAVVLPFPPDRVVWARAAAHEVVVSRGGRTLVYPSERALRAHVLDLQQREAALARRAAFRAAPPLARLQFAVADWGPLIVLAVLVAVVAAGLAQ